jgi:DNA-binding transcriptional MerR regulator
MARARFIRPEFFTDEKLADLPFGARLLFAGIWCHADLRGVFEYSAKLLRVQVFPFDEGTTSKQVAGWLEALEQNGQIGRFTANGKEWGYVRNWAKHQSISTKEQQIGTKRPQPPGIDTRGAPEKTGADTGKTQGQGQDIPEHDTGSDPDTSQVHTQNSSPSPTPSPTPTPSLTPDPRLAAVAAEGGYLDFKGEDLRGQWLADLGDDRIEKIREVMRWGRQRTMKPVRMPSAYCDHRAALAERKRQEIERQRQQVEQETQRAQERAENDAKAQQAAILQAINRAQAAALLALADEWTDRLTEDQAGIIGQLRTAYDAGKPLGLILVRYAEKLPHALVEQAKARANEHTEEGITA